MAARPRRSEYGLAALPTEPDEIVRRALSSQTVENGPTVPDRLTDEPPEVESTDQEGEW